VSSTLLLASLLAGAIGTSGLTAGERARRSQSDDFKTEPPLSSLEDRCRKMLTLQIAVHAGTKELHKVIQGTPDQKPRPEDRQSALKLAADEKAIVSAATQVIDLLEAEKAAFVFSESLREVRKDMERLRDRLESSDVGTDTQTIEQDLIGTLKEMIGALRKR